MNTHTLQKHKKIQKTAKPNMQKTTTNTKNNAFLTKNYKKTLSNKTIEGQHIEKPYF